VRRLKQESPAHASTAVSIHATNACTHIPFAILSNHARSPRTLSAPSKEKGKSRAPSSSNDIPPTPKGESEALIEAKHEVTRSTGSDTAACDINPFRVLVWTLGSTPSSPKYVIHQVYNTLCTGKRKKSFLRGLHACVQGQPIAASRRPAEKASTLLAVAAPIAAPRQAWTPGPELLPTITRALYGAPSAVAAPIVCGLPTGTTSPAYSTSRKGKGNLDSAEETHFAITNNVSEKVSPDVILRRIPPLWRVRQMDIYMRWLLRWVRRFIYALHDRAGDQSLVMFLAFICTP